ncbi:hypothetical protein OE88DRAFT_332301 [Heliocybe sulcata]|uniref:Uncharacterized protein n=1 Tax=Heliocybe sulcata TaxID=5364 RepID=A0A5C3MYC5_9AGAM|nr:hypothetical protein OE88DRAFT_332301 [Heliocybe sulcata]
MLRRLIGPSYLAVPWTHVRLLPLGSIAPIPPEVSSVRVCSHDAEGYVRSHRGAPFHQALVSVIHHVETSGKGRSAFEKTGLNADQATRSEILWERARNGPPDPRSDLSSYGFQGQDIPSGHAIRIESLALSRRRASLTFSNWTAAR